MAPLRTVRVGRAAGGLTDRPPSSLLNGLGSGLTSELASGLASGPAHDAMVEQVIAPPDPAFLWTLLNEPEELVSTK